MEGRQELSKVFRVAAPQAVNREIKEATIRASEAVAEDARNKVPVDTGTLRRSIEVRQHTDRTRPGVVGAEVVTGKGQFQGETLYGSYVEYGTDKMRARPFMRPALHENKRPALRTLGEFARRMIRRLGRGRRR